MTTVGRTWALWAHRYESGKLWNIGQRPWVELHGLKEPIVPVMVEEILGDPYMADVTHYGWQDADKPNREPSLIQIRTGTDPVRSMMALDMCFPYGLKAAIEHGDGSVVALRITERSEPAP
jgi:hypothetical protein